MRRELKKRGMDVHAIQGLHHFTNATEGAYDKDYDTEGDGRGDGRGERDPRLDESTTSAGTRGGGGSNKSRLVDTRKIKELETTVQELQVSVW